MLRPKRLQLFFLLTLIAPFAAPPAEGRLRAAEFDVDGPRLLLRRLQYCRQCGSALLVTRVHAGALVRCPDCGHEQARLPDRHTLTQLYQLCGLCASPLDSRERAPGETVACAVCRTPAILDRNAFASDDNVSGLGYEPGRPPGTGPKTLLHSPDRSDAPITPAPLPDPLLADLPMPYPAREIRPIPRPPESPPAAPVALPPTRAEEPASMPTADSGVAIAVPAVTVDLFGGAAPAAATTSRPPSGEEFLAARVDGRPVFESEVRRILGPVMARLREAAGEKNADALAAREPALRREVLDRLIDRDLAVAAAEVLGHKPDPEAIRRRELELAPLMAGGAGDPKREAFRDVVMADMRRRFAARPGTASPEKVREYYRLHADGMRRPRRIALASLVVFEDRTGKADGRSCRDIAGDVSRRLEQGEPFDALRERHDEFAPAAGVDVSPPLLPESAYASRVLAAAGDLRRGAVFGPVFLEGAAVFAKVVDERPAGPVPFEEVEKEIRLRLEAETAEKDFADWLTELRRKARIEYLDAGRAP